MLRRVTRCLRGGLQISPWLAVGAPVSPKAVPSWQSMFGILGNEIVLTELPHIWIIQLDLELGKSAVCVNIGLIYLYVDYQLIPSAW